MSSATEAIQGELLQHVQASSKSLPLVNACDLQCAPFKYLLLLLLVLHLRMRDSSVGNWFLVMAHQSQDSPLLQVQSKPSIACAESRWSTH